MINVGEIVGTITMRDQFSSTMSNFSSSVKEVVGGFITKLGPAGSVAAIAIGGVTAAAAASVGAMTYATHAAISFADALDNQSKRTQSSVESLQILNEAAKTVGAGPEAITASIIRMQRAIGEGSDKTIQSLSAIGLNLKTVGDTGDVQLRRVLEHLGKLPDGAQKTSIAMSLMGRGASQMLGLTGDAISKLEQRYKDLGIIVKNETVASIDDLGDSLGLLDTVMSRTWVNFGSAIAQSTGVKAAVTALQDAFGALNVWIQDNGDTIIWWADFAVGTMFEAIQMITAAILNFLGNIDKLSAVITRVINAPAAIGRGENPFAGISAEFDKIDRVTERSKGLIKKYFDDLRDGAGAAVHALGGGGGGGGGGLGGALSDAEKKTRSLVDALSGEALRQSAREMETALQRMSAAGISLSKEGMAQVLDMTSKLDAQFLKTLPTMDLITHKWDTMLQVGTQVLGGGAGISIAGRFPGLTPTLPGAAKGGNIADFIQGPAPKFLGLEALGEETPARIMEKATEELNKEQEKYNTALQAANSLAQLVGGSIGKWIGSISAAGSALGQLSALGKFSAAGGGAGGLLGGLGEMFKQGAGGAGGIMGLIGGIGGIATGIGPLVSMGIEAGKLIVSGIKKLLGGRDASTVIKEAMRDMGAQIPKELAEQIHKSGKNVQFFTADMFKMGAFESVDKFAEEVGDIFSVFEQGKLGKPEAIEALTSSIPLLLENIKELGPAGEEQINRIVAAADRLGISFPGLDELKATLGLGGPPMVSSTMEEISKQFNITNDQVRELSGLLNVNIQTDLEKMAAGMNLSVESLNTLGAAVMEKYGIPIEQLAALLETMGVSATTLASSLGVAIPEVQAAAAAAAEGAGVPGAPGTDGEEFGQIAGSTAGQIIAAQQSETNKQLVNDFRSVGKDMIETMRSAMRDAIQLAGTQ